MTSQPQTVFVPQQQPMSPSVVVVPISQPLVTNMPQYNPAQYTAIQTGGLDTNVQDGMYNTNDSSYTETPDAPPLLPAITVRVFCLVSLV